MSQSTQHQGRTLYALVSQLVAARKESSPQEAVIGQQAALEIERLLAQQQDAVFDAALDEAYEAGDHETKDFLVQILEVSAVERRFRMPAVVTTMLVAVPVLVAMDGASMITQRAPAGAEAQLADFRSEFAQLGFINKADGLTLEPYLYHASELERQPYSTVYQLAESVFGASSKPGAPARRALGQTGRHNRGLAAPELSHFELYYLVAVCHTTDLERIPLVPPSDTETYVSGLDKWIKAGPEMVRRLFSLPAGVGLRVGIPMPFYDAYRDGVTIYLQHSLSAAMSHAMKVRQMAPAAVRATIQPRLAEFQFVAFHIRLYAVADDSLVADLERPLFSFESLEASLNSIYETLAPFQFHSIQAQVPEQSEMFPEAPPPGATLH